MDMKFISPSVKLVIDSMWSSGEKIDEPDLAGVVQLIGPLRRGLLHRSESMFVQWFISERFNDCLFPILSALKSKIVRLRNNPRVGRLKNICAIFQSL